MFPPATATKVAVRVIRPRIVKSPLLVISRPELNNLSSPFIALWPSVRFYLRLML